MLNDFLVKKNVKSFLKSLEGRTLIQTLFQHKTAKSTKHWQIQRKIEIFRFIKYQFCRLISETKKDQVGKSSGSVPQPTTEQLMIAQLIHTDNAADDPNQQRKKIKQVMDITGQEEDEVATALFDAGWDQNRAVELLLEGGHGSMGQWEETGKKKKKKQNVNDVDGKEDWAEGETGDQENKPSRQRGPPRMRRGGGVSQGGRGGHNRGGGEHRGGDDGGFEGRPGPRRGDQPPRRGGGRGRGGGPGGQGGPGSRMFNSGMAVERTPGGVAGSGARGEGSSGFSGSIDTWTPPGTGGGGSGSNVNTTGGSGSSQGVSSSVAEPRMRRANNKDAFDNAGKDFIKFKWNVSNTKVLLPTGNWGDDFPAAEDWDNEEYTGSLADTKVFTASNAAGPRTLERSSAGPPVAASANSSNSYSQPIDLSTLLSKPSTQSSLNSGSSGNNAVKPAASLLQFSSQAATESLKAAVGIGGKEPTTSATGQNGGKSDLNYYASASSGFSSAGGQASAFSAINKPTVSNSSVKANVTSNARSASTRTAPQSSKIPSSAVEMPGDALGRLDVSFGGLDLHFDGGNNSDTTGGFEFSDDSKFLSGDKSGKTHDYGKDVTKSVAGGKLNPGAGDAPYKGKSSDKPSELYGSSNYNSYQSSQQAPSQQPPSQQPPSQQPQSQPSQQASSQQSNKTGGAQYPGGSYGSQYMQHPPPQVSSTAATTFTNGGNYTQSYSQQQQNNYYNSSSNYKSSSQQYHQDKYGSSDSHQHTTAALGLTTTTNALSSKVSATSAGNYFVVFTKV